MFIRPGAVSAVACGVIIPGICAASVWLPRKLLRLAESVGRAQDIEEE